MVNHILLANNMYFSLTNSELAPTITAPTADYHRLSLRLPKQGFFGVLKLNTNGFSKYVGEYLFKICDKNTGRTSSEAATGGLL